MSNVSLSISIPTEMRTTIRQQVKKGLFGTPSEYLRHLVREDVRRSSQVREMEDFIQKGIDSGPSEKSPDEIFSEADALIQSISRKRKISK